MKHTFLYLLLLQSFFLAVSSCKGDDEPSSSIPPEAVYDFVTLRESSSEGSIFTMRKSGDSPLITYFSDIDFSRIQTIKDGDRLILCYDRAGGDIYTSGNIIVYGYVQLSSTSQDMLTACASDYDGWKCQPMKVNALWRTGDFINLDTELSVFQARRPETLVIVADNATLDSEYPQLHIYYENAENNDGENPYRVYGSFDISAVWHRPTCRGVTVMYPVAGGVNSVTFEK